MKRSNFILAHIGIVLLLIFMVVDSLAAEGVKGFVDRNQITMGETVQFTLEVKRRVSDKPDTGLLEKDFDVLGVSTSSRINFVNGNIESYTSWIITLSPKSVGVLTIPAIPVAGSYSDPIKITVTKTPKSIHDSSVDIFIETEFEPKNPYLQQQVIYRVRLFYGPALKEGSFADPVVDNAVVKRLGKDAAYDAERNGKRYRVNERAYALFFQASGQQRIGAPVFEGKVSAGRRSPGMGPYGSFFNSDPFGLRSLSRQVSIQGDDRLVNVLPRSDDVQGGAWLPAEMIELEEEWSSNRKEYKVGEPVTRTLIITARGLTGAQLPNLADQEAPGFKVYPDKAEITSAEIVGTILGKRIQKIAYIPERPGSYTLPAVTLQWWNARHRELQTVSLPEKKIKVIAASGLAKAPVLADLASPGQNNNEKNVASVSTVEQDRQVVAASSQNIWLILFLLVSSAWLITLLMLVRERRGKNSKDIEADKGQGAAGVKAMRARFRQVCRQGDPHSVRNALLQWGAVVWPENPPTGLGDLAKSINDQEFVEQLQGLDRILYGFDDNTDWSGQRLLDLFDRVAGKAGARNISEKSGLPDLYPGETS